MGDENKTYTILVVDDDRGLSALIERSLQREGFSTACAASGKEALDWRAENHADLMVLDFILSDMNGETFIQHMAELDQSTPFIVVTGHGDEKIAVEMMKRGAQDYLIKDAALLDLLPPVVSRTIEQLKRDQKLKEAEAALHESEARLRAILDHSSAVIYLKDLEGRYLLVNRQFEKLFHISNEKIVGKTAYDLFSKESSDQYAAHEARVLETGDPLTFDETVQYGGEIHTYLTIDFPLKDKEGRPYAICAISTDITERKRSEEVIRKLNEELEQRVIERTARLHAVIEELESFSYSVAHDLRAPLRAINGISGMIMEDWGDQLPTEVVDCLQRISRSGLNMVAMIDGLLELSRITRQKIQREKVDLSRLASTIAQDLQRDEPARKVEFVIQKELTAQGDPRLIRIVLENLLGNAWKFTAKQEQSKIEFGVIQNKGEKQFFVKDNGVGFDTAYAEKLFGPFQRLHSHKEYQGMGIGLATVQRIIHGHGGHICAESHVGQGAQFFFTLESKRGGNQTRTK